MKKSDFILILVLISIFLPFFVFEPLYNFYETFNKEHGYIMSFLKFFLLAPIGELLGLRIRIGSYYQKGFGLLQRAIVWGFLGITIKMAFTIFAAGAPKMLLGMGIEIPPDIMVQNFSVLKLLVAFSISATMNIFYAPVLMLTHKITDEHIIMNNGSLTKFFSPIKIRHIMNNINWDVMWSFVFKKSIPIFWIPMQTINFLLPDSYRILVAALLGIVLGVIMAIASLMSKGK